MAEFSDTSPADQWMMEVQAEQTLARIDLLEDLAKLAEDDECISMRKRFTDRYRSIVGIDPAERQAVRDALNNTIG